MTDAIVTDRLTKYYDSRRVVDGLNLRVPAGSVYGFLGRNGAGKSTTIKMLLGMVQPSCGRVDLLGYELAALPAETRGRIAYLAENHPLYGWMTVAEASRFARSFHADRSCLLVFREPRNADRRLPEGCLRRHFLISGCGVLARASSALAILRNPKIAVRLIAFSARVCAKR